jgi:hypothetical protein
MRAKNGKISIESGDYGNNFHGDINPKTNLPNGIGARG